MLHLNALIKVFTSKLLKYLFHWENKNRSIFLVFLSPLVFKTYVCLKKYIYSSLSAIISINFLLNVFECAREEVGRVQRSKTGFLIRNGSLALLFKVLLMGLFFNCSIIL